MMPTLPKFQGRCSCLEYEHSLASLFVDLLFGGEALSLRWLTARLLRPRFSTLLGVRAQDATDQALLVDALFVGRARIRFAGQAHCCCTLAQ